MNTLYYQNIIDQIKSKEIETVSFDFFDTLMSRRVPHPKDIFWIMAIRLAEKKLFAIDVTPQRFQALRILAEDKARNAGATKEIGILDIYKGGCRS